MKEAIEEKLFHTFDLAVTLTIFGSIQISIHGDYSAGYNHNSIEILQTFNDSILENLGWMHGNTNTPVNGWTDGLMAKIIDRDENGFWLLKMSVASLYNK